MLNHVSLAATFASDRAAMTRATGGTAMIMTIITTTTHMRGASG